MVKGQQVKFRENPYQPQSFRDFSRAFVDEANAGGFNGRYFWDNYPEYLGYKPNSQGAANFFSDLTRCLPGLTPKANHNVYALRTSKILKIMKLGKNSDLVVMAQTFFEELGNERGIDIEFEYPPKEKPYQSKPLEEVEEINN